MLSRCQVNPPPPVLVEVVIHRRSCLHLIEQTLTHPRIKYNSIRNKFIRTVELILGDQRLNDQRPINYRPVSKKRSSSLIPQADRL